MSVDLRKALRGAGKSCIVSGALILLFVAYQLWGTGIAEARAQHRLRHELAHPVAPPVTSPTSTPTVASSTTVPLLPAPPTGSAIAVLKIPKIGVDAAVVEGVGVPDLKQGPGHYPRTPLPGQPGNTAIAGHRTTYGAPFYHLDALRPGDDIFIATRTGTFHYQVSLSRDVLPSQSEVVDPTADNRLTLTTCTPRFTATKRLVVMARLLGPATAPPTAPAPTAPAPSLQAAAPDTASFGSVSGTAQSRTPAVLWGLLCALIWVGGYGFGRVWKRWPAYAVTAPVFLAALFFFFENFARFVPANI